MNRLAKEFQQTELDDLVSLQRQTRGAGQIFLVDFSD
jgi:hypothetical protein